MTPVDVTKLMKYKVNFLTFASILCVDVDVTKVMKYKVNFLTFARIL